MAALTTTIESTDVKFTWVEPDINGAAISAYNIEIQKKDNTFAAYSTTCSGADATIKSQKWCKVAMSVLISSTYNLVKDDLIIARIQAINDQGTGAYSPVNSAGALVETVPDKLAAPPTEGSATDNTKIQIDWIAPTGSATGANSGLTVTYDVKVKLSTDSTWIDVSTSQTGTTYTTGAAQITITEGLIYDFKIIVNNKYGASVESNVGSITASTIPAKMSIVVTSNDNIYLKIDWSAPSTNNGDPITGYEVVIKHSSSGTYESTSACDGLDSSVITNTLCNIPITTLIADPYNLTRSTIVLVKARAKNVNGWGEYSDPNIAGGVIQTVPD